MHTGVHILTNTHLRTYNRKQRFDATCWQYLPKMRLQMFMIFYYINLSLVECLASFKFICRLNCNQNYFLNYTWANFVSLFCAVFVIIFAFWAVSQKAKSVLNVSGRKKEEKIWNASRICVSSLRRGHANLLCIVPILVYVLLKQVHFLLLGARYKSEAVAMFTRSCGCAYRCFYGGAYDHIWAFDWHRLSTSVV